MSFQRLFTAMLLCLLFANCKKEDGTTPGADTVNKLASNFTVMSKGVDVYGDTLAATHDSLSAINALGQWLLDQQEVKEAYYWSTELVEIHFKNGLRSSILFVKVDANGNALQRGSGAGNSLTRFKSAQSSGTEKIRNNKVLVLNPFVREFYPNGYNKKSVIEAGKIPMNVTVLSDNEVKYSTLSTLSEYGLVILNTHGMPNGFMLTRLFNVPDTTITEAWTREQVLQALNEQGGVPLEKFENDELVLDMQVSTYVDIYTIQKKTAMFLVTEKYIRNSSLDMTGAVVFGNHCYSGYTASGADKNNMPEAWRSKGASSYFGYAFQNLSSTAVSNEFAMRMEDSLISNLVRKGDTTGVAHLADDITPQTEDFDYPVNPANVPLLIQRGIVQIPNNGAGLMTFTHFFDKNYTYSCGDTITDMRDGQQYPTVCIGNKVWMAKNLNWSGAGICYDNDPANCNLYGRLYSITELTNRDTSNTNPSGVQGICPLNWHVPSTAEWKELFEAANRSARGLCTTTGWPTPNSNTNELGFSAMPAGRYTTSDQGDVFAEMGKTGHWWSSSAEGGADFYCSVLISKSSGAGGISYNDDADLQYEDFLNVHYFSCRCVKD